MAQRRRIEIVPYDPNWPAMYEEEALLLRRLFGDVLAAIHHIGSTSVPGLASKPIIDIMGEAVDISMVDGFNERMPALGYTPRGEYGIPGRRYFPKGTPVHHTHHLHVFAAGSRIAREHLAFRDYLADHSETAGEYAALKESLAGMHRTDPEAYTDGKAAFISGVLSRALGRSG